MAKSKRNRKNQAKTPNKIYLWIGALVVLVLVAFGGIALSRPSGTQATTLPDEVNLQQAVALRDQGAFVLDVRTQQEWEEYHVPGSTLIPVDELENRMNELPRDQEILVVCRSGNRSAVGRDILRQAGFEQVTSLAGGLKGWRASGYPVVSGL